MALRYAASPRQLKDGDLVDGGDAFKQAAPRGGDEGAHDGVDVGGFNLRI